MLRRVALVRTDVSEEPSASLDTILHSHRRENLKSYLFFSCFLQPNEGVVDVVSTNRKPSFLFFNL
jgi:hypothetical protein